MLQCFSERLGPYPFPLDGYKLVAAPMLYLIRPGVAERLERFVRGGGALVCTYWSGIVDENDLCFHGGFPGPLRTCLGIWSEELDVLYDHESVPVAPAPDQGLGLEGPYEAHIFCDQIHAEGAEVLATYGGEFYAGRPALTVNRLDRGRAYYLASRNRAPFLDHFYRGLGRDLGLQPLLSSDVPPGLSVQRRSTSDRDFLFLLNFGLQEAEVGLDDAAYRDGLTGEPVPARIVVPAHDGRVVTRPREG
jgi:beta-galactosidase